MNSHRGLFISGVVLGTGLGLMLSHFLVHRPSSSPAPQGIYPFEIRSQNVSASLVPEFEELSKQLDKPYFEVEEAAPEETPQTPPPLQNALAVESAPEILFPAKSELIPIHQPVEVEEPQPLPLGDAVPLRRNSKADHQVIRGIIEHELNHLPAEKQKVWYEALKDVNKEDVAGILKMWKLLGGPIPEVPVGLPIAVPEADSQVETKTLSELDAKSQPEANEETTQNKSAEMTAYQEASAVHLRNIRMHDTPGYVQQIPYFTETQSGENSKELRCKVRLDFNSFRLVETGFPLDLSIQGAGFFMLTDDEGNHYYVRSGRFSLNDEHVIVLKVHDRTLVLEPGLSLKPEEDQEKFRWGIDSLGQVFKVADGEAPEKPGEESLIGKIRVVHPLSSTTLKQTEAGLLQSRQPIEHEGELRGQINRVPTSVQSGKLLFPQISPEHEHKAIELIGQIQAISK